MCIRDRNDASLYVSNVRGTDKHSLADDTSRMSTVSDLPTCIPDIRVVFTYSVALSVTVLPTTHGKSDTLESEVGVP